MIRNYLLIAWRNLTRHTSQSVINLTGLAIGFACCILIALYVYDELSYDNFHEDADRIVSVVQGRMLSTPYPLADALKTDLPVVEETVRTLYPSSSPVSRDGRSFMEEDRVFHVEDTFFDVYSFPLLEGDPSTALREPNTAVVTPKFAEKHFPGENPVGQTFYARWFGEHEYRITGVAESRDNSYLHFSALLSISTLEFAESHADSWGASMFLTFARLQDGISPDEFDVQAEGIVRQYLGENSSRSFSAVPLSGLYLSDLVSVDGFRGEWRYIYLFGTIALIILLLACVNYTNLMTARSAQRAREVGVRRTVGAQREQVAGQFWLESVLLCALGFLLALGLARLVLPGFNHLFDKNLSFSGPETLLFLAVLAVAALVVGLLAGCYPALYLSRFHPIRVLRGGTPRGRSRAGLRKALVVFQFGIAVALIISTLVVYQQLQFTQEKDLGFWGEQVLLSSVPTDQTEAYRQSVLAHAGVSAATIAEAVPGRFRMATSLTYEELTDQTRDDDEPIQIWPAKVDYDYVETLGMEVVAGRDFSREHPRDEHEGHLVNETLVRELGWTPEEAVGRPFSLSGEADGEVIGVVRDFHTRSLREPIRPVVLQLHPVPRLTGSNILAARLETGAIPEGRQHIEDQWARFTEDAFDYTFLDEEFAAMYTTERRLSQVLGLFAGLAIFIACLGLFGVAAFTAQQRTKEIGIRKVLGATVTNIVALLSTDFIKLVVVAFFVAAPVAYLLMSRWLEDFAYRIELSPTVFVLAGILALTIALATVSYHAVRAALSDPVKSLRYE